jgi:N-acetyl-S-(2-succino)cysteine monooxygenase
MMKLGLFLNGGGHHVAAWRDPSVPKGAAGSIAHYAEVARLAERGRFDMLFNADSQSTFGPDDPEVWSRTTAATRPEPITLFAALSMVTTHIGLVATATTTYGDPFHVARFFATLDLVSGGRAGWNLVTSSAASEALNFGFDAHMPHAARYMRAREFAEVVTGLWDSWEDDAFINDKEAGLSFDPAKLHFLNHMGKFFKVRGPLNVPRSPQGRPVIVEAGQSDVGRELAGETAEVVFTVQQRLDDGRDFAADVKRRAQKYGRSPDDVKIMPGVLVVVGATRAEAEAKYESLQALIHPDQGVKTLSDLLGTDISKYPLDGPLPDVPLTNSQQGRQKVVIDLARRENLTIRQLYKRVAGQRAHRIVCDTAERIADSLEEWYRTGAADGFNIMPLTFPEGLRDFVDQVIPELQRRKLFRIEYEGTTLRGNLGLRRPVNRWAAGQQAAQ